MTCRGWCVISASIWPKDSSLLADSSVAFRMTDGSIVPVTDDRLDHLDDYSVAGVGEARNTTEGFWVASTKPEAAWQAVTGSLDLGSRPVHSVAVLTDGAATLVERHGRTWAELFGILGLGPEVLVRRTRDADEAATVEFRGKRHDDATAVLCHVVDSDIP